MQKHGVIIEQINVALSPNTTRTRNIQKKKRKRKRLLRIGTFCESSRVRVRVRVRVFDVSNIMPLTGVINYVFCCFKF